MSFSIRMLGGFRVLHGDQIVLDGDWRPAKAAAIVKILALQPGKTLHRDQLIELLWPDADAEAGSSSFYKNLHHLRSALRTHGATDLVALHRGAVSLADGAAVDIDGFRDAARRARLTGDITLFEQALGNHEGDLLPGDLYEPWTEPHREELCSLRLGLQLALGDRYLQARRYDDAARAYQQALATSGVSEEGHRGLMRAYAMSGQREQALAQYDRCCEILRTALDAEPSDETEELVAEIRSAERLLSPIDRAIAEPLEAAQSAMRRRDWDEASARYQEAIERLHAVGTDAQREGELWLSLAVAKSANSGTPDIADYARRAASLARRAGALDLESQALVQFQAATDALPNNHPGHRESAELIRDALERCPPGASASRARLLAAGARPLAAAAREGDQRHITGRVSVAGDLRAEIEARLRDAVEIARDAGQQDVLAYCLSRLRSYITTPDKLDERLAITRELVAMRQSERNAVSEFESHLLHHEDLLESGDLDGARIEARSVKRTGDAVGAAGLIAAGLSCLVTHATADGDLREGMAMLMESRGLDAGYGNNSNSQYRFGIQFLMLRWHQGRIAELYDPYVRAVDLAPRLGAPRASLGLICAESGRLQEARSHLDCLAADGVDAIPRDYFWWLLMVSMAHMAVATEAKVTGRELYRLMAPFADRNASVAGAVSFGSAALHAGQLAELLGDNASAGRLYETALEFNVRTRQRTWTARTRRQYAALLARRPGTAERARGAELARIAEADAREIGLVLAGPGERRAGHMM